MALSFTLAIDKMQAPAIGRAAGHNLRLHSTQSQLRKEAWFTPQGRHPVEPWRPELLEKAQGLAKRKDAVLAVQFIVQLGNQTDWRHQPEPDFPEGRPIEKEQVAAAMNRAARGIREWVEQEFGEDNCVGIDLHTDESSPHFHVVVTPIKDGKLQAKAWLDGPSRVAALRKRAWQAVNAHIKCEYTPGAAGGEPHDPRKAAGQAPVPAPSLIDKMSGHARAKALEQENAELRAKNDALQQALFSRKKGHYVAEAIEAARKAKAGEDAAKKAAEGHRCELAAANLELKALRQTVVQHTNEIKTVRACNAKLADENNELLDEVRGLKQELGRGSGRGLGRSR